MKIQPQSINVGILMPCIGWALSCEKLKEAKQRLQSIHGVEVGLKVIGNTGGGWTLMVTSS